MDSSRTDGLEGDWCSVRTLIRLSPASRVRDLRCVMINVDPDTAEKDARVMEAVIGLMKIMRACMYAAVVQAGRIQVGDAVHLIRDDP